MERQTVLCLLVLIATTHSCFITNCPPGGKRSALAAYRMGIRECMRCGPGGEGRCYGPDICCGSTIGCQIRSHETAICRAEDLHPVRCMNRGAPCGMDNTGRCTDFGLCCSPDGCFLDKGCESNENPAFNKSD